MCNADKAAVGDRRLARGTLGEALGASREGTIYLVCRDTVTGLEYLHRSRAVAEKGMPFALEAYSCHVFLDWREVVDDEAHPWAALADRLGGNGVPSLGEAMLVLRVEPVHGALRALLDPAMLASVASAVETGRGETTARRRTPAVACGRFSWRRASWPGGART